MKFLPYDQCSTVPNIIVDGTANAGTVLTLSHWRQSGTPDELSADTSTEIVFKYLDSPRFHVEANAVSNNHFDQDGLFGVFALLQPEIAMRHRALLIDAAGTGDFGIFKDRQAARLAFAISGYADPDTSPLPKAIFRLSYPELCVELYRQGLEVLPKMLADLLRYRALWEVEDRNFTEAEKLIENGVVTIEERPDLDLAIVRMPEGIECHKSAIHNRTLCSRLIFVNGNRVELRFRYESWVQLASRRPAPRIDLGPLAEKLGKEDGGVWVFEGVDRITPRLYRKGAGAGKIGTEGIIQLIENELGLEGYR